MNSRKIACVVAACFIGFGLAAGSTGALAAPPVEDVVVEGRRIDPDTQRVVRHADLNLAFRSDQKQLRGRIFTTARSLCLDLNGIDGLRDCTGKAVHSTDTQVAAAIDRAKRQMAGLPAGPAIAITMVVGGY